MESHIDTLKLFGLCCCQHSGPARSAGGNNDAHECLPEFIGQTTKDTTVEFGKEAYNTEPFRARHRHRKPNRDCRCQARTNTNMLP